MRCRLNHVDRTCNTKLDLCNNSHSTVTLHKLLFIITDQARIFVGRQNDVSISEQQFASRALDGRSQRLGGWSGGHEYRHISWFRIRLLSLSRRRLLPVLPQQNTSFLFTRHSPKRTKLLLPQSLHNDKGQWPQFSSRSPSEFLSVLHRISELCLLPKCIR
jgi:hypothetical protein